MREYIFMLLCLICLGVLASHSSTEVYNRRVKRDSVVGATNGTQIANNTATIAATSTATALINETQISSANLTDKVEIQASAVGDTKAKVDEHRTAIQIRDAINRIKKLKPAGLRVIRRVNQSELVKATGNSEANSNLKGLKGLHAVHHQLKRNVEKELHEVHAEPARTSRIYVVSSEDFPVESAFDNFEGFYDIKNGHRRSHALFSGCTDKEKLLDLLTGESLVFNDSPRHINGEAKLHHDPGKGIHFTKTYYVKGRPSNIKAKLKRSVTAGYKLGDEASTIHHTKLHKDDKDVGIQHTNIAAYKQPPLNDFVKLTKMLIDLSEGMGEKPTQHVQDSDVSVSAPGTADKYAEIIYKPMVMDSDDGSSAFAANDYTSNDMNSLTTQQQQQPHVSPLAAIVPMGYHEYSMPFASNMAPLKLQTNALVDSSANKEDSDNDEYEMTCPVHFKRSIESGVKDGVVEVCSCHLYRKKKKLL